MKTHILIKHSVPKKIENKYSQSLLFIHLFIHLTFLFITIWFSSINEHNKFKNKKKKSEIFYFFQHQALFPSYLAVYFSLFSFCRFQNSNIIGILAIAIYRSWAKERNYYHHRQLVPTTKVLSKEKTKFIAYRFAYLHEHIFVYVCKIPHESFQFKI